MIKPTIDFQTYTDCMDILAQAHGWKLSEKAIAAFYQQIVNADQEVFEASFNTALCSEGFYKPANFIGAIRAQIVQSSRSMSRTALPQAAIAPDPDGLARLAKHIDYLNQLKRQGCDYKALSDRADEISAHLTQCFAEPLTDEDVLNVGGRSLSDLIEKAA